MSTPTRFRVKFVDDPPVRAFRAMQKQLRADRAVLVDIDEQGFAVYECPAPKVRKTAKPSTGDAFARFCRRTIPTADEILAQWKARVNGNRCSTPGPITSATTPAPPTVSVTAAASSDDVAARRSLAARKAWCTRRRLAMEAKLTTNQAA